MTPPDTLDQYITSEINLLMPQREAESVILYRAAESVSRLPVSRKLGLILALVAIGGLFAAVWPFVGLELSYAARTAGEYAQEKIAAAISGKNNVALRPGSGQANEQLILPSPTPIPELNPLVGSDGSPILPANKDFSIVIPSIGVNAPIIPGVNPVETAGYTEALKKGVAHASTSYYPNENGTVYLFSHSTNYEWFVKDLNAVFYLLKNVKPGDYVVVMYLGDRYTYAIRETKVVKRTEVAYLKPQQGIRNLILQTCWPPGTNSKRMLIFADLVEEKHYGNFDEEIYKTSSQFGAIVRLATIQ